MERHFVHAAPEVRDDAREREPRLRLRAGSVARVEEVLASYREPLRELLSVRDRLARDAAVREVGVREIDGVRLDPALAQRGRRLGDGVGVQAGQSVVGADPLKSRS